MEDSLKVLSQYTGTKWDAFWCSLFAQELDPVAVEKMRRFQRMFLARYGRQSVTQWDDYPLIEFIRDFDELAEIVRKEREASPLESITEEHY